MRWQKLMARVLGVLVLMIALGLGWTRVVYAGSEIKCGGKGTCGLSGNYCAGTSGYSYVSCSYDSGNNTTTCDYGCHAVGGGGDKINHGYQDACTKQGLVMKCREPITYNTGKSIGACRNSPGLANTDACTTRVSDGKVFCDCDTDCWCVQPCTGVSPAGINLTSPANGASVMMTTVSLQWNAESNWGRACNAPNNTYNVLVGMANPTTSVGTVPAGTTTFNFTGRRGTTYYWRVMSDSICLTKVSD